jgi:Cu(I)/Ag(I) efflux system membrane fusion protein
VRAIVNAHVGDGGHVLDPYLAGKWVCPMHPEVVKEELGICDVCEMDLVPAEDLGFVSDPLATNAKPIVVPKSAVLVTGRRAIVYIVVPDSERPTYEGREVVLGPRAGDEYIILSGLEEGEEIVANGAFRIDSAMQISAKPSMMSMDGDSSSLDGPGEILFRDSLAPLYSAYLGLQGALAGDDLMKAREALEELREALQAVTPAGLQGGRSKAWEAAGVVLEAATLTASEAAGIEAVRVAFGQLSESMLSIEREFGHAGQQAHREAFCPMAFDFEGASWLQLGEEILNPYFGAEMLRCGSIKATFQGAGGL